jgi:ribosome-associated protein
MDDAKLIGELQFKAVRSSGAGGQNVNKVASKVMLTFDIPASAGLDGAEKARLLEKLAPRLTSGHVLVLSSDEDRSQLRNKDIVTRRFLDLIRKALVVQVPRKATKVPRSVIEKRIKAKRSKAELKQSRQKPRF